MFSGWTYTACTYLETNLCWKKVSSIDLYNISYSVYEVSIKIPGSGFVVTWAYLSMIDEMLA